MQTPSLFNSWADQAYIPEGTKFPALFMYNSFIRYCDGRFNKLPRKVFYSWLRTRFGESMSEGKDSKGLWLMIGDKQDLGNNKISEYDFRVHTCDEFVRWFTDTHADIMYEKVRANDVRNDFFRIYANDGNIFKSGKGIYVTKQRFNSWMDIGSKFLTSSKGLLQGRDGKGKWLILI
jgi:hypothetical protein